MSLTEEFATACSDGQLAKAKKLLAKGANPNRSPDGWTGPPIVLAMNAGHEGVTKWLLSLEVKKPKDLICWAAYDCGMFTGKFGWLMRQLIDEGANLNQSTDYSGETPLFYLHDPKLVQLAIKKGANVDHRADDRSTPLHRQAKFGPHEVIEILLAHGADLHAKDKKGKKPIAWAKEQGVYRKHTVKFLEERMELPSTVGTGSWKKVEEDLFARSVKAIAAFAKKHKQETFDRFMFDCNAAYAEVLLCVHSPDEDLTWEPGNWKHQGFAQLELDVADLKDGQDTKPFMEAVCRTLIRLENQKAFDPLKRTPKFEVLAMDHDETESTARARLARARKK
jgi:hypothetical protein